MAPLEPTSVRDQRVIVAATAAALFLVGVLLYLPSVHYGFVEYDDVRILLNHPGLYDEHSLTHSLHEIFVGYFPREEPLLIRDVSWAIDSRLYGFRNGFGYHLGNVLLNAVNGSLLFLFLLQATRRLKSAVLIAFLFVVLPIHVEPVCWVMGRKDVLSAAFVFAALCCESTAFRGQHASRLFRGLGFVASVLAMLSKTSTLTLPLVIAAYRLLAPDLAAGGNSSPPPTLKRAARAIAGVAPHLVVSMAVFFWYQRTLHQFGLLRSGALLSGQRITDIAQLMPLTIGLYLKSLFGLTDYSIYYLWPDSAIPLSNVERLFALLVVIVLVTGFVWLLRRRRDLLFFFVAAGGFTLPYLHLFDVTRWRADRYFYLASFCVLSMVVYAAASLLPRASRGLQLVIGAGALVWAIAAALVTVTNEPRFHDNESLWSYELSLRQPSVTAYNSLASSLLNDAHSEPDNDKRKQLVDQADQVAEAGVRYYQSIPFRPNEAPKLDYADLYVQRGRAAALKGAPLPTQLEYFGTSYRIFPTESNILFLSQSLFNLAVANQDLSTAQKSLRLYGQLVSAHAADAPRRPVMMRILEAYRHSFPALAPEVDALEGALRR